MAFGESDILISSDTKMILQEVETLRVGFDHSVLAIQQLSATLIGKGIITVDDLINKS